MIIRNIFQKVLDRTKKRRLRREENDESPFERCVICGKLTTVRKDTHIDYRDHYEICLGQMCYECDRKNNNNKPVCSEDEMRRLIEQLRRK